jgi:hypothetical protein
MRTEAAGPPALVFGHPACCGGLGILTPAQTRPFIDHMPLNFKNSREPDRIGNTVRPFGIFLERKDEFE